MQLLRTISQSNTAALETEFIKMCAFTTGLGVTTNACDIVVLIHQIDCCYSTTAVMCVCVMVRECLRCVRHGLGSV